MGFFSVLIRAGIFFNQLSSRVCVCVQWSQQHPVEIFVSNPGCFIHWKWILENESHGCSRRRVIILAAVADRTRENTNIYMYKKTAGDSLLHAESDLLALRERCKYIEVVKYKCIVIYGCNSRAPHGTQYANESHGKFCLYTSAAITTSVINIFSPQRALFLIHIAIYDPWRCIYMQF